VAWSDALPPFLLGLAPAALLARPAIRFARRAGWVSSPRPDRFSVRSVPLSGGPVLFAGLALPALALPLGIPFAFLLLSAAALGVGIRDDMREMRPAAKAAATLFLAACAPAALEGGGSGPGSWAASALGCFAFLHVFNLLDNMDGVALGTAFFAFIGIGSAAGEPAAIAAAGAAGGLLLWNLPPARIFLGDGGSLLAGLWAWGMTARGLDRGASPEGGPEWLLLLPWILPAADTAFVAVSRPMRGRPPWVGGKDHLTHRLAAVLGSAPRALAAWLFLELLLVLALLFLS